MLILLSKMKHLTVFSLCIATFLALSFTKNSVAKPETVKNGRIIGGQAAKAGQFPSIAAIYVTTKNGLYFCGGSLINQQFVLTSAHCITGGISFKIILGSNTLQKVDENSKTVTTSIYIVHPDFNPNTLEHDVGLIKFHLPITYTEYISSVRLSASDLLEGVKSYAVGWGATSDASGLSNELNYVPVTSISRSDCQLSFGNQIFDTMVCVEGNYNEGACRGDFGSPLIITLGPLQWTLGIATFVSSNGCESTEPSGYTKIYPYISWIKKTAGIP